MITELKLSNFRVFGDEVTLRVRPITVLIGENNSGKSTLIKFLLMLQQSLDSGGRNFLNPEGEKVRLGNFASLQNVLTKKKILKFELTTDVGSGGPIVDYLRLDQKNRAAGEKLSCTTRAEVPFENGLSERTKHEAHAILGSQKGPVCNARYGNGLLNFQQEIAEAKQSPEDTPEVNAQFYLVKTLRENIRGLYHLKATRNPYGRGVVPYPPPGDSVGRDGAYTLSHLQNLVDENHTRYLQILPHIQAVAGIRGIEFDKPPGPASRCFAINKTTGARVYIGDFGFGVSQCLPVFVQGAIMPAFTQLMVEQPEAQIHPTAQLEMGGFFADLWCKRKVGCIVETHSDNLILRLRRLVAKGDIHPDDVSIAYIEPHDKCPVIKNLDVLEDGEIAGDDLPMQFFGANLREVLNMRGRK